MIQPVDQGYGAKQTAVCLRILAGCLWVLVFLCRDALRLGGSDRRPLWELGEYGASR